MSENHYNQENTEELTQRDIPMMHTGYNYLEAIRRGIGLDEIKQDMIGKYSDFMLDGDEPNSQGREFLDELQEVARSVMEEREQAPGPVNAQVCVKVSFDAMTAWIFVFPPLHGGKDITEELILDALSACNVLYGVDEAAVHYITRRKAYLKLIDAARGREPLEGKVGSIIDHYPRLQISYDEEMEFEENEAQAYEKAKRLHTIRQGDVICDLQMPVYSKDGITVSGAIIKSKEIPALDLPMGANIGFNQDMTAIVSEIGGTLVFDKGKFVVKDTFNLFSNADLSNGNIDTIGNLVIHGDVKSGISVRATGNIVVQGMVGNANVVAGGDLTIGMGIRGTKSAFLKAGGKIECRYMENCTARAGGSIQADSIINCQIHSDETVEVKKLIGGAVFALHKVKAKEVGLKQRKETLIYLGITTEKLKEKDALQYRIRQMEEESRERIIEIRALRSKAKREEGDEEKLYQLLNAKEEQERTIEKYTQQIKQLDAVINDMSVCDFTANRIYPPVKVMILSDSVFINREENMCRVWTDEGEIRMGR